MTETFQSEIVGGTADWEEWKDMCVDRVRALCWRENVQWCEQSIRVVGKREEY